MVQEALTNVLKHAGPAEAQVVLTYTRDALEIEVLDSGTGRAESASVPGGHGLVGLRERARILGGTLEYGAVSGAGFRVTARLPSATGEAP